VPLGGKVWSVVCQGRDLVLKPVTLPTCRVRIAGLSGAADLNGWSCSTGQFKMALDHDGAAELVRDKFQLWTYECTNGDWQLTGNLRGQGILDPPANGPKVIEAGPKLACALTRTDQPDGVRLDYRCAGRAKETVTVTCKRRAVQPCFVVLDSTGKEVFRKVQGFG